MDKDPLFRCNKTLGELKPYPSWGGAYSTPACCNKTLGELKLFAVAEEYCRVGLVAIRL